jgi:hypothetical protein
MKQKEERKRLGKLGLNRHHWINKSRGGATNRKNISWLKIKKHRAWHFLFKNKSLREVIKLLKKISNERGLKSYKTKDWEIVFKDLSIEEAIKLLERTMSIKNSQKTSGS